MDCFVASLLTVTIPEVVIASEAKQSIFVFGLNENITEQVRAIGFNNLFPHLPLLKATSDGASEGCSCRCKELPIEITILSI
jgi:hypothetical protein